MSVRMLIVFVLLLTCVCRRESEVANRTHNPNESAPTEAAIEPSVEEELELLRSLGYVDHAPEPADLQKSGVTIFDQSRSHPGYNLYTIRGLRKTELIDARGRVIHTWQRAEGDRWVRSFLMENGHLLVVGSDLPKRWVMCLTWDSEIVWNGSLRAHHDIRPTEDGRFVALTLRSQRIPAVHPTLNVRDDQITVFSPDSDHVDKHSLYKMLTARPDIFTLQEVAPRANLIDLFHANSVRWMTFDHLEERDPIYTKGNMIVSMRHQDAVAIFDWKKHEVMWGWGQGKLSWPHDATVLDNGNILIFDNGRVRKASRVIELDPLARKIVWSYSAEDPGDFYTSAIGAAQRLENGNTLITESHKGHAFEVTRDGQIVWEYFVPHLDDKGGREVIVRLYRYDREFIDRLIQLGKTGK